ncbi:RNA polymerase sigma-70 factor (ECF subfamily) [Hamadaea flava]|uniref:RNA polymerase sigma factor n=1 Tax=Hamadaea flava TaxID=1742688 RepID=A0ABV8LP09_9ACTN|nr:sigma-70 family RNA polymerase sigma factor [Hamadaea flava]MCP2322696.1 RNA polymerase sigma-70 factor (ECF subfamily) [Hamadaea flava]
MSDWVRCTTGSYRLIGGDSRHRRPNGGPRPRPVVAGAGRGRAAPAAGRTEAWQLVVRIQRGDVEAVGEFYDRFNTEVYKYIWLWCGEEKLAQQLVREVWDRALRLIGGLRATADSPLCWLLGLARDRAVRHFHSRRYRLGLVELGELRGPEDDGRELLAAVRRLSPPQQEAIALTFFCGLDEVDAAAVMGRTPAMVQALTKRGRVKLAAMLTGGTP